MTCALFVTNTWVIPSKCAKPRKQLPAKARLPVDEPAEGNGNLVSASPNIDASPKGTTFRRIAMSSFDLSAHGITVEDIRRNLAPAKLYAEAIREEPDCAIADLGALIAYSHAKT